MPKLISSKYVEDQVDKLGNRTIPYKHIHFERLQRESPKSVVKLIKKKLKEQNPSR